MSQTTIKRRPFPSLRQSATPAEIEALTLDRENSISVPAKALQYIAENSGERTIRDLARRLLSRSNQ